MFNAIDWARLFVPTLPLLELFVRASVIFLAIFALLRVTPQRQASGLNISDIIVVVLIADAASPGLVGQDADSLGDGIILVAVILFWNFAINWVAYRVPLLSRFVRPAALLLVKDGKLQRREMRQEMVTEEELMTSLRQNGLQDYAQVERAHLEGDGTITVVAKESERQIA